MNISKMFQEFTNNLKVQNTKEISYRYGEITSALNKKYRVTESKTSNTLQVGSYGRYTAINGISDLDMIYILPNNIFEKFKNNRQSALLQEVKKIIKLRYPSTDIRGDGQVVVVKFTNHIIEILPVFELDDGSFKYPDTNNGGSWKITKPRLEIEAIRKLNTNTNGNLRQLSKIVRAWKNKHGVNISGMLIDTLVYNFFKSTEYYNDKSFTYYDLMIRDFFYYLFNLPIQEYYLAPSSNQYVYVKKRFQAKAKKAYKLCIKAIEAEGEKGVNQKWKKLFGRVFPSTIKVATESRQTITQTWKNTEEFIEDIYPFNIQYNLRIDCKVSQEGFLTHSLREMLQKQIPLFSERSLTFEVKENNVPKSFEYKWKVLNRGEIAKKRDMIRGQIIDNNSSTLTEKTNFLGEHEVECYVIKNDMIVARDTISVPIQGERNE